MRTLYLARHGKSSWGYPELDDSKRPLKPRGEKDAHFMGKLLRKKDIKAGLIISSPATRAYETAVIFAEELRYDVKDMVVNNDLYLTSMQKVLEVLKQVDDEHNDVFVFGHNPVTLELVNNFADTNFENVPTAGVACIQFSGDSWKDVTLQNGRLRWLDYPSMHKE